MPMAATTMDSIASCKRTERKEGDEADIDRMAAVISVALACRLVTSDSRARWLVIDMSL